MGKREVFGSILNCLHFHKKFPMRVERLCFVEYTENFFKPRTKVRSFSEFLRNWQTGPLLGLHFYDYFNSYNHAV